jgi:hypothetical protein
MRDAARASGGRKRRPHCICIFSSFIRRPGEVFMGEKISAKFLLAIFMAIIDLFLVVGIQWHPLGNQCKTAIYMGMARNSSDT